MAQLHRPQSPAITLTNCDREPIHIPGSIQAHGFLLALDDNSRQILMASENVQDFIGVLAVDLIGTDIIELFTPESRPQVESVLHSEDCSTENPLKLAIRCPKGVLKFDALLNSYAGRTTLEFEPVAQQSEVEFKSFYHLATKSVERMRAAKTLNELYQISVDEVRRVTNFDRVVIYQFDEKWDGRVPAESRSETAQSYLDLHFPSTDIPSQVRDLYSINPLRNIATVNYEPSPIIGRNGGDASTLDLSLVQLRNVSPIHIEYLRNMEVSASMSISIMKNKKLWGLISCSHESGANYVSYDKRAVCTFLTSMLSSLLPYFEDREDVALRTRLLKIQTSLVVRMTESQKFVDGLFSEPAELIGLTNATGVAAYFDEEWKVAGVTPKHEDLDRIRKMISENDSSDLFVTNSLSEYVTGSRSLAESASGLLGFSISKSKTNYILWFRPEVIQTVKWGGNPNKPVEIKNDQQILHPRKSFELWKETVRQKSLRWSREEIEAASALRSSITDIVLQRVEQVTKLNTELERSNIELDSFAYAASHDLKEPLRGIASYSAMLARDNKANLDPKSGERLETIQRLSKRAEALINSLLDYSQIGRSDLVMQPVPLSQIVAAAIDTLKSTIDQTHADVTVGELPTVMADKIQMTQVFTNLITNAIKYNLSDRKEVRVEMLADKTAENYVVRVRDNGIGIEEDHFTSIFKIFKRLHSKDEFGGGTGTGLTIVKKIVERHGGTISVESELGKGTLFLISLPKVANADRKR